MNIPSDTNQTSTGFFRKEPKFSVWIILVSTAVVILALVLLISSDSNYLASHLNHQSLRDLTRTHLPKLKNLLEQITSGLGLIPR